MSRKTRKARANFADTTVTVPVGTDVKFLEVARSGLVSYQEWLNYWDKQIIICILGKTLTTDIGSNGSRAASEAHEGPDALDMLWQNTLQYAGGGQSVGVSAGVMTAGQTGSDNYGDYRL